MAENITRQFKRGQRIQVRGKAAKIKATRSGKQSGVMEPLYVVVYEDGSGGGIVRESNISLVDRR